MSRRARVSRRQFLGVTAAGAATTILPRQVLGGPTKAAASDTVNFAIIGCGAQGGGIGRSMGAMKIGGKPISKTVALCDVNMADGRTSSTRKKFGDAKTFQDFRVMFEKMGKDFDACSIGVPDHAHFPIAMLAMSQGKHIYVEKPLAHTFEEVELMMQAEKKYKVACQMGNQGHSGANYFQFKAWTEAGVIKDVTHIDAFMNSPRRWHGWKVDGYPEGEATPATMDWDTWIATGPMHPYSRKYDPGNWRSWYVYGNGAFGDWGPHILDTAHRFLKLGLPTEVEAVKRDGPNDYIFPQATTIAFRFPAREGMPACEVLWYDGTKNKPPRPKELEADRKIQRNGKFIFGKDLTFMGGTHSATLRVIPETKMREIAKSVPRVTGRHSGHHENFLLACVGKEKTRSSFDISGPLTQVFLLGVIAQRLGGLLKFDPKTKQITNNPKANSLLNPPPRKGWEQFYTL